MEKCLLLCAIEHNWGLCCPGMWGSTTWKIYNDGSFEIVTGKVPETNPEDFSTTCGIMSDKDFEELRIACLGRWMDHSIKSEACDGVAWQIRMYSPNGRIVKSTGKDAGYIYGQKKLEQITQLLPEA